MRGKGIGLASWDCIGGITPAYAGKREIVPYARPTLKDHPRLCGEKANGEKYGWGRVGSPPPMRGKETYACSKPNRSGITPAYAGKSIQRYHS